MRIKPSIWSVKGLLSFYFMYLLSLTLKSQTGGEGTMTQFYIVIIVFTVIVLAAVISFFVSKKRKD
ncbi:MAG: hypothetical protein ACHQFW_00405 [Chitinophagales bacterium]